MLLCHDRVLLSGTNDLSRAVMKLKTGNMSFRSISSKTDDNLFGK